VSEPRPGCDSEWRRTALLPEWSEDGALLVAAATALLDGGRLVVTAEVVVIFLDGVVLEDAGLARDYFLGRVAAGGGGGVAREDFFLLRLLIIDGLLTLLLAHLGLGVGSLGQGLGRLVDYGVLLHIAGVVRLFVIVGLVLVLRPLLALRLLVAIQFISWRVKFDLLWLITIPWALRLQLLLPDSLRDRLALLQTEDLA